MSIKEKLLAVLNDEINLDIIGEEVLVDLLIDAFKRKNKELKNCRTEVKGCLFENIKMREDFARERSRTYNGSLRWPNSEYFFVYDKQKFCVQVRAGHITMFERKDNIDFAIIGVSREEWLR